MTEDDNPIVLIPKANLRQMANNRVDGGNLILIVDRQRHRSAPPTADLPYCTHTQMILFRDRETHDDVIFAHQYLRPDGTIGGFGRPDPKWILENGVIYKSEQGPIIVH
jgi:hypothetical protein